jgi:hypothetical protein
MPGASKILNDGWAHAYPDPAKCNQRALAMEPRGLNLRVLWLTIVLENLAGFGSAPHSIF